MPARSAGRLMKLTQEQFRRTLDELCTMGAIERFFDAERVERFRPVAEFGLEDRALPLIVREQRRVSGQE